MTKKIYSRFVFENDREKWEFLGCFAVIGQNFGIVVYQQPLPGSSTVAWLHATVLGDKCPLP
jgi:hypothetical protein